MTGFTDNWARRVLDHSTGKTSIGTLPTIYIGLFTVAGIDAGTGFTEVTGGSYARVATTGATWNAAGASAPSTVSNVGDIIFPPSTASWGSIVAAGAFDASTAGTLLWWDYLGLFSWLPFTCTLASPGVITAPVHGYGNGDTVVVSNEYGGILPATAGSWTGLLTVAGGTADTFTAGVNTTGTGSGSVRKVGAITVGSAVTLRLAGGAPGALQLTQA
jgi:hypothetical protein